MEQCTFLTASIPRLGQVTLLAFAAPKAYVAAVEKCRATRLPKGQVNVGSIQLIAIKGKTAEISTFQIFVPGAQKGLVSGNINFVALQVLNHVSCEPLRIF